MKEGLLELICNSGYWRVNLRPLNLPDEPLLLGRCQEVVEKARVSIRGWDFPHINYRNDDAGGYERGAEFIENWTEWSGFNEFWRMYKSTQFLAYVALREDTKPNDHDNPQIPILNIVGTVYQITEILEFCHRLYKAGLYQGGVSLGLSLYGAEGRMLSAGQNGIPFHDLKQTHAEQIEINKSLGPERLAEEHMKIAIDICVELFDHFGWNPDSTQLQSYQEGFYRQDYRY
ncbi:MAG: hypothetical protein ABJF89_02325 [Parasphingorhabdus sp.]|uniref:hypothetical protein n=1 Tax=Sphingomonadales TaxID=204457 RepID=UPI0032670808